MTRYDKQNVKYKVINTGKTYSTYESWIRCYYPEYLNRFQNCKTPIRGEILRKIGEAPHRSYRILPNGEVLSIGDENYIIYLFESTFNSNIYIMDRYGVKKL